MEYEAPVATYWSEFALNGKDAIMVEQLLSHQAALTLIDAAEPDNVYDWDGFVAKIAAQEPNWEPGTRGTYHSITYGFLVGELVRRVSARPIAQFLRKEITGPLGADSVLGATDADLARWCPPIANADSELTNRLLHGVKTETLERLYRPFPLDPDAFGKPAFHQAVIPSANGISHAAGLARLFAPLATEGEFDGYRLFSPRRSRASAVQWHYPDPIFDDAFCCTMGLLCSTPFSYFGPTRNVGSAGGGGTRCPPIPRSVSASPIRPIATPRAKVWTTSPAV